MRTAEALITHIEGLLPLFLLELRERKLRWDDRTYQEFREEVVLILVEAGDFILYGGHKLSKKGVECSFSYQKLIEKWGMKTPTNALIWAIAVLVEEAPEGQEVKVFDHVFN